MFQDAPSHVSQGRKPRFKWLPLAKLAEIIGFVAFVCGWLLLTAQVEARLPAGVGQGIHTVWWSFIAANSVWAFWKMRQLQKKAKAERSFQIPTETQQLDASIVSPIRTTERGWSVSRIMTPIAIHGLLLFCLLRVKFEVDRIGLRLEGLGLVVGLAEVGAVILVALVLGRVWRRLHLNDPAG